MGKTPFLCQPRGRSTAARGTFINGLWRHRRASLEAVATSDFVPSSYQSACDYMRVRSRAYTVAPIPFLVGNPEFRRRWNCCRKRKMDFFLD